MKMRDLQFATIYIVDSITLGNVMFRFADTRINKFMLFAGVQTFELKSTEHLKPIYNETLFNILIRYHNIILKTALEINYSNPDISLSDESKKMKELLLEMIIDPEISITYPTLKYPAQFISPAQDLIHKVDETKY